MTSARPLPPRDTHGPTPLAQCAPVADLAAHAREIEQFSRRIIPLLPVPLRNHVRHAGLRNDRILLLVESPAWATRVRMDQSRILVAVQRELGLAATAVAARVVPPSAPRTDSATPRSPSPRAARSIRTAALAIADPDLRALFLELAALEENPAAE